MNEIVKKKVVAAAAAAAAAASQSINSKNEQVEKIKRNPQ